MALWFHLFVILTHLAAKKILHFFKADTSESDDCSLVGGKSSIEVDSTSSIGICTSTFTPSISPLRSMIMVPVFVGITGEK